MNYLNIYSKLPKNIRNNFKRIYCSEILNIFRRAICLIIVKIKYNHMITGIISKFKHEKTSIRLHLGCGGVHLKDYINIDIRRTKATDYVCDVTSLPFFGNSVEIIETYHMIEHLPKKNFLKALENWFYILVPGGKLVIEFPDFDKIVQEYLGGNEERLDDIFGLQRFKGAAHFYGYNFKRLKRILEQNSFERITVSKPEDYHKSEEPCLRVEAYKKK